MSISSASSFQALLETEAACVDRYGRTSCLIRIETPDGSGPGAARRMARAVRSQARAMDTVAELSDREVGILLPDTAENEAARFVARIRSSFASNLPTPEFEIRRLGGGQTELHERQEDEPRAALEEEPTPNLRVEPNGASVLLSRPLPAWKRAMDVVLAGTALLALAVPMLLIAIAIKLTSRGPVFYRQRRTGRNLRRFTMYKFRSMVVDPQAHQDLRKLRNEMSGPLFKMKRDPRVTLVGAFLRKTSLDELPQLWNVLKGDMTLIGPRALSPVPSRYETWQLRRFDVTPGVACRWQATRRAETDFTEWMRSDLRYLDSERTARGDLRLLFKTLWSVVTCRGGR